MKIAKKFIAAALATCMVCSLTSTAQTINNEETDTIIFDDSFTTDTAVKYEETIAAENGIIHWSDILGYDLEAVQKKLSENPPIVIASEQDEDDFRDYRGTVTKDELIEMGLWVPSLDSPKKLTPEETRFILKRLSEVKEPEDEYIFDHGDIYLDTRWRDVTVSSEGFPGYMPDECLNDFINPISSDKNDRVKVSAPSVAPAKYVAEILVLYEMSNGLYDIYGGTSFFVGKDILLTTAHCLYDSEYGLPDIVQIFPGGVESGIDRIDAYTVYPKQDNDHGCEPNDYGVICLDSDKSDGYFGLSRTTNANLKSAEIYLYGFPSDKPNSAKYHYEFWISHGYIDSSPQLEYFFHTAYAVTGCSGGPLILNSDKSVVGIHSGSYYGDLYAVRITPQMIQFVNKYR